MELELLIQNGSTIYYPVVEGKIKLTWERKNTPGKLEFTVVMDEVINIQERKPVKLKVDGKPMINRIGLRKKRDNRTNNSVTA